MLSLSIHFEIILYPDFIMIKDWCGICGGDNSTCTEEKGVYNRTVYGYNTVVRIPSGKWNKYFTQGRYLSCICWFINWNRISWIFEGAINIEIRQYGYRRNNNDDTYIALRDVDTGEYILNGDFVMSMFRKTIQYGGTTLEYSVNLLCSIIIITYHAIKFLRCRLFG